jgi:2-polyprenyl-6-methoxyphenol hydroxylase-like FAD-dependent oxidoreductase
MQRSECTAPISSSSSRDALPDNVVHAGHRCTGFDQRDDVARVSFSNGEVAEADVIVAADGIHSELRALRFSSVQSCFLRDPSPIARSAARTHSGLAHGLVADVALAKPNTSSRSRYAQGNSSTTSDLFRLMSR